MPAVLRFAAVIMLVAAATRADASDPFASGEPAPFPSSSDIRQVPLASHAQAPVAAQPGDVAPRVPTGGIAYPASHQLPAREPEPVRPSAGGLADAPPERRNQKSPQLKLTKPDQPALQLQRPASTGARPAIGTASSLLTMLASLGVVLGIFLILAWLLRRNMPKNSRTLPSSVVEVLGRAPLVGRQQMHLLRFGNKLLLVSVSPGATDTIAELTDPLEIDRIAGLCQQSQPTAATEVFRQVLGQFSGPAATQDEPLKFSQHASTGKRPRLGAELEDHHV